jgi:hypothetical protein
MNTIAQHAAEPDPVRQVILRWLAAGVRLSAEIAKKSGIRPNVIGNNLVFMERDGLVARDLIPISARKVKSLWKVAPPGTPAKPKTRATGRPVVCGERRVIVRKEFPAVGKRDPLVAALFGAPKQSAPVCTACKVEQGKGHLSGCVVALVAA